MALSLIGALQAPALAQPAGSTTLRGVVADPAGVVVEGALASLDGAVASSETNSAGEFVFRALAAGEHRLLIRRLGFRAESLVVAVGSGHPGTVHITMQPVRTLLPAVRVTGHTEAVGPLAGFNRRRATGSGRFFTADDVDKRSPSRMTDLLRSIPGLSVTERMGRSSVRLRGSRCAPVVFLDGQALSALEIDLNSFDPYSFAGIEVYSGVSSVPLEFQRNNRTSSGCGTIVLWSKRGEPPPRAVLRQGMTASALISRMIDNGTVLTADLVDTLARVDSTHLIVPIYPEALFQSATAGRVLAEFVVADDGDADMQTFNAVTSTNPAFVEAVRNAVRQQRFRPAIRAGQRVHQVMQLPFQFVPDSVALLRKRR